MKKTFKKCHFLTIAYISTLVFSLIAPEWAQSAPCSNSDLKGNYTYSEQGSTLLNGVVVPITEVGIIKADGASPVGHFTINATANWGTQSIGIPMPLKIVFTTDNSGEGYNVQPDCTGTAMFSVTVYDATGTLFFQTSGRTAAFVVNNKNKAQWIITSQGTIASGIAEKISP